MFALTSNTTGQYNTGLGKRSLFSNESGQRNTAVGFDALYSTDTRQLQCCTWFLRYEIQNADGNFNVAIGNDMGVFLNTGGGNTFLGARGWRKKPYRWRLQCDRWL